MLTRVVIQLVGLVLSIGPLFLLLFRLLKDGWRTTFVSSQRRRPAALEDSKHGQHGYVKGSGGVQLHYVEKGDRTKPLMLFLHGFPEFWYSWRFQLAHFSSDYWCVAIDMRGYNDSSKPSGIRQYSLNALVADVKAVIEGLGRDQCNVLVAHDWGGAVGYAFCARWPQMVGRYVALNIPHPSSIRYEQKMSWKQRLMSWYMVFFQCPVLPEIFFRSSDLALLDGVVTQMKNDDPKEIKEAYKYAFRDPASVTSAINYYRCAMQYPADSAGYYKDKDPIKVPVLSIFGTADKYLSVASAKGTQRYVETLRQEFLEGVGHWVQMESPDQVNKIMSDYLLE